MKKVLMVKIVLILLMVLSISGCALGQGLPTLVPKVNTNSGGGPGVDSDLNQVIDESPRTGSALDLPPTWTPGALEVINEPDPPQAASSTVEPIVDETTTYVVQQGDTLAEIAEQFNVTLEQLATANGIEDLDHIETGQELLIPSP